LIDEICGMCYSQVATKKIEEVIFNDDPMRNRHPHTQHICTDCFRIVMNHKDSTTFSSAVDEPMPTSGKDLVLDEVLKHPSITSNIRNDLEDRAQKGLSEYGTYLQSYNGRNATMDAYQESLDLLMYMKQMEMEEKTETLTGGCQLVLNIILQLKDLVDERET